MCRWLYYIATKGFNYAVPQNSIVHQMAWFVTDILLKATFYVHKLIPTNAQMTTEYTNWSLYITFTMIYYIRQE